MILNRLGRALTALLAVTVIVAGAAVPALRAPAAAEPWKPGAGVAGMINPEWIASHDGPSQYPRMATEWDVPIRMSDGTVLRANIFRPADASGKAIETAMPTIVNMTPYTKFISTIVTLVTNVPVLYPALVGLLNLFNFSGTPIAGVDDLRNTLNGGLLNTFTVDQKLVQSGYTQVVVDVRGTGNSQGVWQVFAQREQQDTVEVLDWIRKQSWTNGRFGMAGVSYSAINQLQVASKNPEGLQALFPVVPGADIAADIVAPGGGLGVGFIGPWLAMVNILKFIPDLRSLLNGTFDWKWLQDRLQNPAVFVPELLTGVFSPTVEGLTPTTKELINKDSTLRAAFQTPLDKVTTPTFALGGWNDLFTNTEWRLPTALSALSTAKKKLIMGDAAHVTVTNDMGGVGQPTRADVLQKAWFDKWLKDADNGIDNYAPVTVHRMGGGWWQGDTFPEPEQKYQRMYLSSLPSGTAPTALSDNSLQTSPPKVPARRTVGPGLSTLCSNDTGQAMFGLLVFQGCTKDNRVAEMNALTFTSKPVGKPTVISGPINLRLNTTQDAKDAYWSVMVTDVGPDGRSEKISSGQLTTSLRQIDESRSTRTAGGDMVDPYYKLNLADRQLVAPGQVVPLDIGTHAVSAVLKPGHRLRVDVFALNLIKAMTVGPVTAETQFRPQHVLIDPKQPSYLVVPSDRPLP
ncbi:Peptidase S15 OS=Tsukamurella paurometabola (strain ATCC 8368 / DSM / CCUG 35730 / CIP 100753/ JCM 10117 / KCTC 9821 / NBRC 16120 / NCIMB 702349 / NCTC 13040) OX=521096 GN=Tpau_0347 PE=4 SV=1 [Tsukamurella paurometabola]|uniref:Peptidase S15 n=1 Tax=Tsukamurella paurometabola (strain ATCC 8368 / DSM 20162 / CCUG 35730 / CIP 100753 / JCM 10117 / KCTC 9821 / NBRC 16120 / NCIMB 702349 / NCTC 13040) TaxID=521096 RepID=D5URD7_TSUPD|nr:CocE/NonD family hydrolase [Tsukamurella paurometabola]ADG76990.1 peptidase S15 [Tsukamurella paurometabola DSM 20162]SUP42384.1 Cocaine esterase [Tsukamurella paurometabola]